MFARPTPRNEALIAKSNMMITLLAIINRA